MRIIERYLTKNPCYTCGRTIAVRGLTLHSVGCPQPNASAFVESWNNANHDSSCVHAFIDGLSGDVYQTLPWNRRGWHAGSGSRGSYNNSHIGVEMCEPDCIRYTGGSNFVCTDKARAVEIVKRTYKSAVQLFAYLCKLYSLNPLADGVIVSHKEAHARGYASGHEDPEHLWRGLGLSYTMDTFRHEVSKLVSGSSSSPVSPSGSVSDTSNSQLYRVRKSWGNASSQIGAFRSLENAKRACRVGYSVFDSNGNIVHTANSITEVAKKVIAGRYGNGAERKRRLEAEGYDYSKVQAEVNRLLR